MATITDIFNGKLKILVLQQESKQEYLKKSLICYWKID